MATTKTLGELLNGAVAAYKNKQAKASEIGIWVNLKGKLYSVSITNKSSSGFEFLYVTLGEDDVDEDDVFTMRDLYKRLRKTRGLSADTEIFAVCDDDDADDDSEKPVKSFKFEKNKVILSC